VCLRSAGPAGLRMHGGRSTLPDAVRYRLTRPGAIAVAIGAPIAAAVATLAVNELTGGDVGFLPELVAVLLVAGLGGLWPGIVATLFGAGLGAFLFLEPFGPAVNAPVDQWQLFLFVATGLVASSLIESLHRARWRVERARDAQRAALRAEHAVRADLESIVAAIGDGIIVTDAAGSVRLMNEAATRLLGAPLGNVAQLLEALKTDDESPVTEDLIAGPEPIHREFRFRDRATQVELSSFPIGEAGNRIGMVVLLRDVTAARRRDLLREAFLSLLSHELRTPITAIYGGASVLGRSDANLDPGTRNEILKDVVEEANRLERLVEDLLVLARLDEGVDVGHEPALLQHLVPAVINRDWPDGSGPPVHVDADAGLPPVGGDETSIQQVVHNLVSNAAKYSPAGSVVDVKVERGDDEVLVRVLDRGRGLSAAEASRVFEPFYRSEAAKRMAGGAGIGLFVCRRLIEAMGGRIWAEPREGGGSVFAFALSTWPMDPEEAEDTPAGLADAS
ncbi:MAG: ATP-binding protein, partial [Candidatus Limnocylindria bacterium]